MNIIQVSESQVMEQQSFLNTFEVFLGRKHYRGRVVPLHQMMRTDKPWNDLPILQVIDSLYGEYRVVADWRGYKDEEYVDLWCLGIVQFVYACLHQGKFCQDAKELSSLFFTIFPNTSVNPMDVPQSLRVMSLKVNEKNDLDKEDVAKLILDVDLAREPENKLKYVCNYLYNNGKVSTLAEILAHYGDLYASPIPEEILVKYWLIRRLCGTDEQCLWKALQHVMKRPENSKKYEKEVFGVLNGNELQHALQNGFSLDFPLSQEGGLTYRRLLCGISPLAEKLLRHIRKIPKEDRNFHDEHLFTLSEQAIALTQTISSGEKHA
jgi:hypothetical protein